MQQTQISSRLGVVLFSDMGLNLLLGWGWRDERVESEHLSKSPSSSGHFGHSPRITTAHCNNTTHTDTCLFPKTNTTVSFYHLSLQRHYFIQVTDFTKENLTT